MKFENIAGIEVNVKEAFRHLLGETNRRLTRSTPRRCGKIGLFIP